VSSKPRSQRPGLKPGALALSAVLLVATVLVPATAFAAGNTISVSPATTTISPAGSTGSTFTVSVNANAAVAISGAGAALSFDNTKLQLTALAKDAAVNADGPDTWAGWPSGGASGMTTFIANANAAGQIPTIAWAFSAFSEAAGADHGIFSATFQVIAAGDTALVPVIVPGVGGMLDGTPGPTFGDPLAVITVVNGRVANTVAIDLTPPTATLKAPVTPTKSTTLSYALTFSEAVTGLAAADFTRTGTATGCVVGAPTGSGAAWTVPVTTCGAGTVILALKAGSVSDLASNAGPVAAVIAATVTIDTTVPTATAPVLSLRTGVAATATTVPVSIAWTGADNTGGSGIARYELAKSTDGGTTWTSLSTTLTASPYATTVAPSGTVAFRVRAVDRADNVGAWMTGPVLNPRLVQETGPGLTYTGTWATSTSTAFSGGTAKASSTAGASATYTFTGRSIGLIMTLATTRGSVNVYVDGATTPVTVSTYAATTTYQAIAWQQTWTTTGTHTVKLVVAGTPGHPQVDLDAVAVVN